MENQHLACARWWKKKAESRRCMMYNNRGKYVSGHRPSSSSSAAAADTSGNAAIPYHLLLNHQVHNQVTVPFSPSPLSLPHSASGGATGDDDFPMRDERFPQWSIQEIRDLIGIRAQFELELVTAKRGENLWETVANRMRDKGYRRTPDQFKCRWNILVTKYKDYETCDVDNNTHYCPFFEELHEIFASRSNPTHPPHISVNPVFANSNEALGHAPKTQTQIQTQTQTQTREDFSQEPDKEHETEPEQTQSPKTRTPPKRKTVRDKKQRTTESEVHPEPSRKNAGNDENVGIRLCTDHFSQMETRWKSVDRFQG